MGAICVKGSRRDDSWIFWILLFPTTLAIASFVLNPSNFMLNNTTISNQPVTADCQNYKNQADQQQTQIEELNKQISDCRNQNPYSFSIAELVLGIAIGAIISTYWFWQNEKKMIEKYENPKKTKKKVIQ
jgi:hypothetical protein